MSGFESYKFTNGSNFTVSCGTGFGGGCDQKAQRFIVCKMVDSYFSNKDWKGSSIY
jgi:hypothetical protein